MTLHYHGTPISPREVLHSLARNHNRPHNDARKMADRWDAQQCPARWQPVANQLAIA